MTSKPPNRSRHCPKCNTYWTLDHAFTSCPLCDVSTSANEYEADFETTASARAHIADVMASRARHEEFERYYTETYIPAQANALLDEIKRWDKLTHVDLAAHFAKLVEHPS